MEVSGIENVKFPIQFSKLPQTQGNPVMSKDLVMKLLSMELYMNSGLTMKLVRIAGDLYTGKNIDELT